LDGGDNFAPPTKKQRVDRLNQSLETAQANSSSLATTSQVASLSSSSTSSSNGTRQHRETNDQHKSSSDQSHQLCSMNHLNGTVNQIELTNLETNQTETFPMALNGASKQTNHNAFEFIQDSKQTPLNLNGTSHTHIQNGVKHTASANSAANSSDFSATSTHGLATNGSVNPNPNNGTSGSNGNLYNDNNDNESHNGDGSLRITNLNHLKFSNGQKDVLRIIGQYLRYLGLNKTTEILTRESGCMLEHPIASNFCNLIMNGNWEEAELVLNSLVPIMEESNADISNMRFLILEQKYLENLEDGKILDALRCLRDELAPLKYNIERLHELSSFLMCTDQMNLKTLSKWAGKNALSRQNLMDKLQTFLPPSIMLPPHRLESLLGQSITYQCEKCPYHNSIDKNSLDTWSFLKDHVCSKYSFI